MPSRRHTVPMRYRASVDVDYAPGQPLPDEACHTITASIERELAGSRRITVTDVTIAMRRTAIVTVEATLAGVNQGDLTNPLHALACLDTALDNALLRLGCGKSST